MYSLESMHILYRNPLYLLHPHPPLHHHNLHPNMPSSPSLPPIIPIPTFSFPTSHLYLYFHSPFPHSVSIPTLHHCHLFIWRTKSASLNPDGILDLIKEPLKVPGPGYPGKAYSELGISSLHQGQGKLMFSE